MAVRGDDTINGVQERPHSGRATEKPKWPGPPDASGEFHHGVSAAEMAAISQQQAQFAKQGSTAQAEALRRVGRLQRAKLNPSPSQDSFHAPRRLATQAALAVREEPTGDSNIIIWHFCIQRNSPSKKRQSTTDAQ
jgi:hypothetical protein